MLLNGDKPLDLVQFRRNYSSTVLLQMLVLGIIALATLFWQFDTIRSIYFENQLLQLGLLINGVIFALFLVGVVKIVFTLFHYNREENAIVRFLRNIKKEPENPLTGIAAKSMISQRYLTMQRLYESRTPINHGAMASTLVANESTKVSLPRFINNVLILTGVFGTIVSLSIALVGASDMLEGSVSSGGMGMVIHGMSTALSTTMTAIACYLYFGYFYFKLTDAQTNLVSGVEEVTTAYLSPKFQVTNENIVYEFTGLLRLLQKLTKKMDQSQTQFAEMETAMSHAVQAFHDQTSAVPGEINEVKEILKEGFRLTHDE